MSSHQTTHLADTHTHTQAPDAQTTHVHTTHNTAPDNTLPHSIPQTATLPDNRASDNNPTDNTAPHSPTHLIAVIYHARGAPTSSGDRRIQEAKGQEIAHLADPGGMCPSHEAIGTPCGIESRTMGSEPCGPATPETFWGALHMHQRELGGKEGNRVEVLLEHRILD